MSRDEADRPLTVDQWLGNAQAGLRSLQALFVDNGYQRDSTLIQGLEIAIGQIAEAKLLLSTSAPQNADGQEPEAARPGVSLLGQTCPPAPSAPSARAVAEKCAEICEESQAGDGRKLSRTETAQRCAQAIRAYAASLPETPAIPPVPQGRLFKMMDGPPIPWWLAEVIWQGYAQCGGRGQPLEVVEQRGGFGWDEVAYFWKQEDARKAMKAALAAAPDGKEGG